MVFLFNLIFFGGVLFSAVNPSLDIAEVARLRLYDGGIDEQPLQVQSNLYIPSRTMESLADEEAHPEEEMD